MNAVTVYFLDADGIVYAVRSYENREQAQEDIENLDSEYDFVVSLDNEIERTLMRDARGE